MLARCFTTIPLNDRMSMWFVFRILANYILWRFVRHRVNNLDNSFLEVKQQFYRTLVGREEAPVRWKMCVSQVHSNMGMALGAMFVEKYFDESSKKDVSIHFRHLTKYHFLKQPNNCVGGTEICMAC